MWVLLVKCYMTSWFQWHGSQGNQVQYFLLNLCKIKRHVFIYLGFTSQRSQRSVQYNLNQNFAHSADLKGKIKSCAEYRILTHFKYCFYKRLLFDIWIFMDQNNDNIICNRIKLFSGFIDLWTQTFAHTNWIQVQSTFK